MPRKVRGKAVQTDAANHHRRRRTTSKYARTEEMPGLAFPPEDPADLSRERPMIGLSGGINSAAVLVYVCAVLPEHHRPRDLFLFHADLVEHSPDTVAHVAACHAWARRNFRQRGLDPDRVRFSMRSASVVDFFERERFIPHRVLTPCTEHLKLIPMRAWAQSHVEAGHGPTCDLIGFVTTEDTREDNNNERQRNGAWSCSGGDNVFPIRHLTNADCLRLVDEHIGWHPAIYDIRQPDGRRAFSHNNCLPCKNMNTRALERTGQHFPKRAKRAVDMAERIGSYWAHDEADGPDGCSWACST